MSKKQVPTFCFVIDASIAEAAGTTEPPHLAAKCCRDFLISVRSVCHRMAWSQAIKAEWDKHKRGFATQWLVTMRNLRKLRPVQNAQLADLREAISEHSDDQGVVDCMLKDAHLFEAALATDLRIASLDENARGHYTRLAASFDPLQHIMWVDPVAEGEQAVKWLEAGAPTRQSRKLKRKGKENG